MICPSQAQFWDWEVGTLPKVSKHFSRHYCM